MARQFMIPFVLLSVVPVAVVLLFAIAIDGPTPGARPAVDTVVKAPTASVEQS